jgi:hypothetical protein
MKEVFRHSDAALVTLRQSVLESAGIQTFVRNWNTQQALVAGLLTAIFPIPEFWPTLCVMDDDAYREAMELLIDVTNSEAVAAAEWVCSQCGESVPRHFAVCWNCGHLSLAMDEPTS